MSYPEKRYFGDRGQHDATFRPADTPPEIVGARTSTSYLATGASTGGDFGLYRWDFTSGEPAGPAPHLHKTISESFFVLSGEVRLFDGERWVDARSGDFLYVPPGGTHAFRNESGEPASMLILFAPGAPRENYFETLAAVGKGELSLTDEEWTEFYLHHDTYWEDTYWERTD